MTFNKIDNNLTNSLKLRMVTGITLGLFATLIVAYLPAWCLALIISILCGLELREFTRLAIPGSRFLQQIDGVICAAILPWTALLGGNALIAAVTVIILSLVTIALAKQKNLNYALHLGFIQGWGVVYLAGTLSCLILIVSLEQGRTLIFFLVTTVVATDTGAYFAGHAIGRHPLAPRLSPSKTWEGVVGGLIAAAIVGIFWSAICLTDIGIPIGICLAIGLAIFSIIGDLLESALKRVAGTKDSGALLPGHGGLLDRLDGITAASPLLLLIRELWW